MFDSIYYSENRSSKRGSIMAARRLRLREKESENKTKLCAYTNFNPLAVLGFVLLFISIVLMCVSLGLDSLSEQRVRRGSGITRLDSSTYKTQGFLRRCIQYVLSDQVILPADQLPTNSCISMSAVSCETSLSYLESGHDTPDVMELQNTDDINECKSVRNRLWGSFSLTVIGLLVEFVAMVTMFPTWHRIFFIIGAIVNIVSSILFALALTLFLSTDSDYAGFFSLNGRPNSGCLGISFGLFVGSFAVSVISSLVCALAFCYRYIENWRNKRNN